MHDDRVGGAIGVARTVQRAPLQAFQREILGVLQRDVGHAQALDSGDQTRSVHHGEHGREAAVLLADQFADRVFVLHFAGGRGLHAHLVVDPHARHAVAFAERAVVADEMLRHHEQADAASALGGTGQAGENEVDDVLGQVVFAGRDPDLGAGDPVRAVVVRFGPGADQPQVGTALGLGQVHCSGPPSFDHRRQETLLLGVGAVGMQDFVSAVGQPRICGEGRVRGIDHLGQGKSDETRQALATVFRVRGQAGPAVVDVRSIGLTEPFRQSDRVILEAAALPVADLVERLQDLLAQAGRLVEHRVDHVRRGLGHRRQRSAVLEVEVFVIEEAEVFERGVVAGHAVSWMQVGCDGA